MRSILMKIVLSLIGTATALYQLMLFTMNYFAINHNAHYKASFYFEAVLHAVSIIACIGFFIILIRRA